MKKTLALFVAVVMTVTMALPAMSVFAETPDYSDYVASAERTDNLIANNTDINFYLAVNTEVVRITAGDTASEVNYTYIGDGSGGNKWSNFSYYGTEGTWAKSTGGGAGQTSGFNGYYPNGPESFVVEMQLKNAAPTVNPNPEFTFSVFTARAEGVAEKQIVPVTATDDWQTVKTVFHTDAESPSSMWIALGYGGATSSAYPAIGTSIALYKPSLYVAVEKANDINVTGTSVLAPGGSAELKAQVVNQVGLPGNLTQDFTWTALNADRSATVEGFSFTEGEDGAVTVNVADTVAAGKYVILAAHDDETSIENGVQKGIDIVVSEYQDYEASAERPENLIANNTDTNFYLAVNTEVVSITAGDTASEVNYTYIGDGSGGNKWSNFSYYGTEGTWAKSTGGGAGQTSGFNGYYPDGPESFVVEMQLKNAAPTVNPNPEFTFSVFTARAEGVAEKQIVPVTATDDWQTVKTVFHTDAESPTSMWIALGYGGATSSAYPAIGTSIALYKPSLYVSQEVVHDITVTGDAEVAPGGTAELKAQVVNQIGIAGNLTQDFTWTALDADRSEAVEGFSFTEGEDGAVTVNVADTVAAGKYVILAAHSDAASVTKGIRKGIEIEVKAATKVTETSVTISDDKATFSSAKIENAANGKEILFVIASYDELSKKMIDAKGARATVADGIAQLAEEIKINANAGNTVRVFAWYADTLAPVDFASGVANKWE